MNDVDQNINPMVRIDGGRIRGIREKKGLTQLYVATSVGVTTDTISRWENKRYPSIKGENAERLAEALEVDLEDILESQSVTGEHHEGDQPSPSQTAPALPPRLKKHLLIIAIVLSVVATLLIARYFSHSLQAEINVSATRTLPPHVPSGQLFPVLVRVDTSHDNPFSLIIRETLPPDCQPVAALPPFTSIGKEGEQIRWVSRLEGDSMVFAYLVRGAVALENTSLVFSGQVLAGSQTDSPIVIHGDQNLVK